MNNPQYTYSKSRNRLNDHICPEYINYTIEVREVLRQPHGSNSNHVQFGLVHEH